MKWNTKKYEPGDIVRVNLGNLYHYGIYVSEDEVIQFGLPNFNGFHFIKDKYVHVSASTFQEFAAPGDVDCAILSRKEKKNILPADQIIEKARNRIGEGKYHILNNNSEHFVYDCCFGAAKSHQEEVFKESIKNKSILDVYFSKIPEGFIMEPLHPAEKNADVEAISDDQKKKQEYWAWSILESAIHSSFYADIDNVNLKKDKYGRYSTKQFYFSVTYCRDYVCVAVSKNPIGISLEMKSSFEARMSDSVAKAELEKKLLCKNELSFAYTIRDLLLIQQKKESIYRCYGKKNYEPEKIDTTKYGCCVYFPEFNKDLSLVLCGENIENIRYFIDEDIGFKPL